MRLNGKWVYSLSTVSILLGTFCIYCMYHSFKEKEEQTVEEFNAQEFIETWIKGG